MILFGSYARGDFNGFSDVDLIVVDHKRDQADRLACSIQEQGLADDLLTLNLVEWNQKKKSDSFFWKSILQESLCLKTMLADYTSIHCSKRPPKCFGIMLI